MLAYSFTYDFSKGYFVHRGPCQVIYIYQKQQRGQLDAYVWGGWLFKLLIDCRWVTIVTRVSPVVSILQMKIS